MAIKYGFVCTNYNNSAYTEKAILSLEAGSVPPVLIVVVDNCSDPSQVARIEAFQGDRPNVELIKNAQNVGYFSGLNIGIRRMLERHPNISLMVVGNNDLEFPPKFGETLQACRTELTYHPVVAPNIITFEGVHQNPHAVRPVRKVREAIYSLYYSNYLLAVVIGYLAAKTSPISGRRDVLQHDTAGPIFMGMGACYILTETFFKEFKELWSPTFLMHEEYFLALQLAAKGYSTYYHPDIKVMHHHHATVSMMPSRRMWSIARDAHRVYRRYVGIFGKNPAFPLPMGAVDDARLLSSGSQ